MLDEPALFYAKAMSCGTVSVAGYGQARPVAHATINGTSEAHLTAVLQQGCRGPGQAEPV